MPYIQLMPAPTQSGGRTSTEVRAWTKASGLLMLSPAVVEMLGDPEKVIVEADTDSKRIRLTPSTPDDGGAFTLSGAGTSRRIYLKAFLSANESMIGNYDVKREARSVVLQMNNRPAQ
jgi:hypothetical protein